MRPGCGGERVGGDTRPATERTLRASTTAAKNGTVRHTYTPLPPADQVRSRGGKPGAPTTQPNWAPNPKPVFPTARPCYSHRSMVSMRADSLEFTVYAAQDTAERLTHHPSGNHPNFPCKLDCPQGTCVRPLIQDYQETNPCVRHEDMGISIKRCIARVRQQSRARLSETPRNKEKAWNARLRWGHLRTRAVPAWGRSGI